MPGPSVHLDAVILYRPGTLVVDIRKNPVQPIVACSSLSSFCLSVNPSVAR